jgi:hypothetical protein
MSRLKYRMRLASLRVRGRASVGYRTFLRALGLNIHRVAAYRAALRGRIGGILPLSGSERLERRPSGGLGGILTGFESSRAVWAGQPSRTSKFE